MWPPAEFGPPTMNLIAVKTTKPTATEPAGKWFEAIKPEAIVPPDIHQAQLARRLGSHPSAGRGAAPR